MSLFQPEDWVAALSCRPLAVIVTHPLTRNPNYNSMKPCECLDLCCVCEREAESVCVRVISVCLFMCVRACVCVYVRVSEER